MYRRYWAGVLFLVAAALPGTAAISFADPTGDVDMMPADPAFDLPPPSPYGDAVDLREVTILEGRPGLFGFAFRPVGVNATSLSDAFPTSQVTYRAYFDVDDGRIQEIVVGKWDGIWQAVHFPDIEVLVGYDTNFTVDLGNGTVTGYLTSQQMGDIAASTNVTVTRAAALVHHGVADEWKDVITLEQPVPIPRWGSSDSNDGNVSEPGDVPPNPESNEAPSAGGVAAMASIMAFVFISRRRGQHAA